MNYKIEVIVCTQSEAEVITTILDDMGYDSTIKVVKSKRNIDYD